MSSSDPANHLVLKLSDDGVYPNNISVPLVLHRETVAASDKARAVAEALEDLFSKNDWEPSWRGSLYSYHHYHATTHEAIGVMRGTGKVQFGGPNGLEVTVSARDVVMIPAGVAHCLKSASSDFAVVGAYPLGHSPDMRNGQDGERPLADRLIEKVPSFKDPVDGKLFTEIER